MRLSNKLSLLGATFLVGLSAAPGALAQSPPEPTANDEIVVTGSRIPRASTFNFPVPLAVADARAIVESGSAQLGDVVSYFTQINPNNNLQNTSGTLFNTGQNRADLRGLGSVRTLVLVDGRRHIYTDARSPGVDLNMIPSMMVERIEVISGGASAVYGSDAISGVVNVILRKDLNGWVADAQIGMAEEGDGEEQRYSVAYGDEIGERFRYTIGGEYSRVENIMAPDRWGTDVFPGVRRNNLVTPQPVIDQSRSITGPTLGTWVLSSTRSAVLSEQRTSYGLLTDPNCFTAAPPQAALCQDPLLGYSQVFNELQGGSERGTVRAYAEYDLSASWKIFGEAAYAIVDGYGKFQPAFSNTATMPILFRGDNAFMAQNTTLSNTLRGFWTGTPGRTLTSTSTANVIRFWPELGGRNSATERTLSRAVVGLEGEFDLFSKRWSVDAYYQWAEVKSDLINENVPWNARVQQAVDAIVVNGQIVCRNNTNGCVPYDIINGPSQAAIDWVNRDSFSTGVTTEEVASANFSGELFDLPAGPVGIAGGAEYRKEENTFSQDALSASGVLFINALGSLGGAFDITEGYLEVRVPLLADLPLVKELSFEAAGRIAEYSTFGETDAHRYVLSYRPLEHVWFRASQGSSVRGPNVVELYAPQGQNFLTVRDPCDPTAPTPAAFLANVLTNCAAAIPGYNRNTFISNIRTQTARIRTGGNPDLLPEEAETTTIGVVFQPTWVENFAASFDYWHIELEGGISSLPAQTTIDLCYRASGGALSSPNCTSVIRDSNGSQTGTVGGVVDIVGTNLNLQTFDVEGWDASVQYAFEMGDLGHVGMRVDVTRAFRFEVVTAPGQDTLRWQNTVNNALPEWKGTISLDYDRGPFSLGWTTLFIGSMAVSSTLDPTLVRPYYTGDQFTHDLRLAYQLSDDVRLRGGILNLSNEYPPPLPETFDGRGTGSSVYDNRGRFLYIGANFEF
ncbi:MAG: TonB-dependent receptor [Hyphomonadaceae bacterium]|nr:TonB-dependent receptor [Hyphomonadaceae bacterium]